MKNPAGLYNRLNTILGWGLFLVASAIYITSSEPTVSFWDCGEYIATAYKLQVGHPPGAPLFQMIGRFFSLFSFGDTALVARMINTMSAMASGLTITFLFWSITMLARKLVQREGEMTQAAMIAILGSGLAGALAYTFTDSFWFSAVEGEVYAMSSFFTAMTFWAILRWESVADQPHALRWIILIAFLIGLSVGVHLLNLLAIPAVVFVYYFRNYKRTDWKALLGVLVLSFLLVAAILYGLIPEVVTLFASTERWFVNVFGLPFNSGSIFFALLLAAFIVSGLMYTIREENIYKNVTIALSVLLVMFFLLETSSAGDFFLRVAIAGIIIWLVYHFRRKKKVLNAILLSFAFILIGYSSFLMLVIRANADPPINENNPDNAVNLLSYLNREQYGTTPLFYGPYYNAPVVDRADGTPLYGRDNEKGKYVIIDDRKGTIPVYDPKYMTIFPRMWNNQESRYIRDYKNWAGITNDPDNKHIPTFSENLRFFFRYQISHMYFRYFFWNFIGRQNDVQGMFADLVNGNWLSGIKFIDDMRLGPQEDIPESMKSAARNSFYFLPLIFGLIGMIYHFRRNAKDGIVVALLFLMTGLAITIYLNQQSPQPRERDYAYAASFYAFAIWIGISVTALYEWFGKRMSKKLAALLSAVLVLALAPTIMGRQGWDDHDRSGRYTALQMAKNYLNSCEQDAILFTNGDNDTFPLWYAQEVEGIRTDVRVCNLSLLSTDWYISQMKRQAYDSSPVPFMMSNDFYRMGKHDYTFLVEQEKIKDYVELKDIFNILEKDEKKLQITTAGGTADYFPTKKFKVTVNPEKILELGVVPEKDSARITSLEWRLARNGITKNYMAMMDLLAHNDWKRPVYYVSTTSEDAYIGLGDYLHLEGLAYRLLPMKGRNVDGQPGTVNTDAMFDNLMNRFEFNITTPGLFISDDVNRMAVTLRNTYSRLAMALLAENKNDSAVLVCDRSLELIPDTVLPYDYFNLPMTEVYMKAGQMEKGTDLLERISRIQIDRLDYFFTFPDNKRSYLSMEIEQSFAMLQAASQVAEKYGLEELLDEIDQKVNIYYNLYVGGNYNP